MALRVRCQGLRFKVSPVQRVVVGGPFPRKPRWKSLHFCEEFKKEIETMVYILGLNHLIRFFVWMMLELGMESRAW